MPELNDYKITKKWPAQTPEAIQLYSLPTPNGVKISIMLEETSLPYEAHLVNFGTQDQHSEEFLSLNPNNKIPAIIDPNGPDGTPLALWESGAILTYLADKTGQFLPPSGAARYETLQWLLFQIGGLGPMFGQLGYFHIFAGKEIEDPRPKQRYIDEAKRILAVVEARLNGRDWIMGEYSIADIAIAPWLRAMRVAYKAEELIGMDKLDNAQAYLDRFLARPAVDKGVRIPARPPTEKA